ncbi:DUF3048 domain-containing protein [Oerskovia sp. M15]
MWEEVVEGGITRFVAVYHSQAPETVGPIRSVRPMDPAIVAPMHGVLVYSGAQQPFIDAVGAAGIQSIIMDAGDDGFFKQRGEQAPTTSSGRSPTSGHRPTRTGRPRRPAVRSRPALGRAPRPRRGAVRVAGRPPVGQLARAVAVGADENAFLRNEGTKPALAASGARLSAANVVVLSVEMTNTRYKDPRAIPSRRRSSWARVRRSWRAAASSSR